MFQAFKKSMLLIIAMNVMLRLRLHYFRWKQIAGTLLAL